MTPWLREQAEKAARRIVGAPPRVDIIEQQVAYRDNKRFVADAIEAVAKQFAERACRKLVPVDIEIWLMDEEAQDRHVAAAIEAAEKG